MGRDRRVRQEQSWGRQSAQCTTEAGSREEISGEETHSRRARDPGAGEKFLRELMELLSRRMFLVVFDLVI